MMSTTEARVKVTIPAIFSEIDQGTEEASNVTVKDVTKELLLSPYFEFSLVKKVEKKYKSKSY